ncbi:alpha/beta hydrolase [Microbacterium sp. NPDC091662]|uniref:alpha/beta hydrolase n=1 Tax=Microbacterium sp. NPDC091662 TaxID=3364211 RepID=UPI00381A62B1
MTTTLARPPFDPELAAALAVMPQMPDLTIEMIPGLRETPLGPPIEEQLAGHDLEWFDVKIPGHGGDEIVVTVVRRRGRTGTGPGIYLTHGGGMIMGDRFTGIVQAVPWIEEHDAVAVTVEYRLAPEFPDPYPVEDSYAGLVWTAAHADELGIDPERLIIAGGSAGGGLAAGVTLLARDRKGPALAGQLLMCPMLDDRDETVSTKQIDGIGVWDRPMNVIGWTALLGDRKGTDDVSIYASPARATDLTGLPPAYIDCGSAEVFRDEDVAYATAIWAAGGQAELHVWAGGFHGFEVVPHAIVSQAAVAARNSWIARTIGG